MTLARRHGLPVVCWHQVRGWFPGERERNWCCGKGYIHRSVRAFDPRFRRNLLGYDHRSPSLLSRLNISTFFVGRSFFFQSSNFEPFDHDSRSCSFPCIPSNNIFLAAVLQVINNMTRISVTYDDTLQDSCAEITDWCGFFSLLRFNRFNESIKKIFIGNRMTDKGR